MGQEQIFNALTDVADNLAELLANEESLQPNQLLPKRLLLERFQMEISQELELTRKRITNGSLALMDAINPEQEKKLSNFIDLLANRRQEFIEKLSQDKTLQEIASIDDATMEQLYLAAKNLYDQKNFSEAEDAFGLLTILNAANSLFWLGLGNCEYEQQKYKDALHSYSLVSITNPENYFCHIFSCRCYEALEEYEHASNSIELALFILQDNAEETELKLMLEMQIKRFQLLLHKSGNL